MKLRIGVDNLKFLNTEGRHWGLVEFGDLVKDLDGIFVPSFTDEKLGRLVERENKVTNDEHHEGDHTDNDHFVSPTHIAGHGAACLPGAEARCITSGEIHIAPILGRGAKCDR